mgnify:CR=1 FL=1
MGIEIEVPVRWGDMDALRHVNNAQYFTYCETARIAYFEKIGLFHVAHKSLGPSLAMAQLNFRRQLHYPATLVVEVSTTKIGRTSFTLQYVIRDQNQPAEAAASDGTSVVVWVDYSVGKPVPLPEELINKIIEVEKNPDLHPGKIK